MSLQFQEEYRSNINKRSVSKKSFTDKIVAAGLCQNTAQAEKVLAISAGIGILIAVMLLWPEKTGTPLSPQEIHEAGKVSEVKNF